MKKAIFLDRDGTINVEKHYLYRKEDFEFLPGVINALKKLQNAGYMLIIITNQSGIARGYYTEKDFHVLNEWMLEKLKAQGVEIAQVYFCPHLPNANVEAYRKDCNCRKPKLGLFQKAINEYDIQLSKSYAIGDKLRDCAICDHTMCRGYLIEKNEDENIIKKVKEGSYDRVNYANSLADATDQILKDDRIFIKF